MKTVEPRALGVGCAPAGGDFPSLLIPPKKKKSERERERSHIRTAVDMPQLVGRCFTALN